MGLHEFIDMNRAERGMLFNALEKHIQDMDAEKLRIEKELGFDPDSKSYEHIFGDTLGGLDG